MKTYIELGSSPCDEDCVQVIRDSDYIDDMRKELLKYKDVLKNLFCQYQKYGRFSIRWFNHEFGRYGEVVFEYDDDDEMCENFAFFVQDNLPLIWNDINIRTFIC